MQCLYLLLLLVPAYNTEYNTNGLWRNSISSPVDPCTDKNHFFLAPGVLTAGSINRACISRFYPDGPANLLLTLHVEGNQTATAARDLAPGDGGCLDIAVPLLPNTKAELKVNIRYPGICSWERKLDLRIASGRVVAVHTERARYRPGETMRARVFALKADLTPAHTTIEEIWLEGPPGAWEGTRIAEWIKVRSKMGLAQIQHDIDEQAPAGRWSIRARLADGSQGSAEFLVGNYDLPPFQLTVRHAPRVLRTSERVVWTVCVRYPWSEAVSGMLVVRLRAGPVGALGGVRTALRLRSALSCHRHAAAAARLALAHHSHPDLLIAHFSFQEEGTRVWQNTTVVSQIVDKPISLQFLTKPNTVLSPGLPYKLKVKATRFDDKPAHNERIKVCRTTGNTNQICAVGDSDDTGIARIMFHAEDNAAPVYTFVATLANDSTTTTGPLTLTTRNAKYQAALGPLRVDPNGARTFVPLYLSLQNASIPVTVHFVVITRGGIIYRWGATTQCPIASSYPHIQIARRNTKCDSLPQYDDNKTYYDSNFDKNNNSFDLNNKFGENRSNFGEKAHNLVKNTINNDENSTKHNKTGVNFDKNKYYDAIKHKFERIKTEVNERSDNETVYDANADALLDRHLLRVMLPIKVTQQMCPDSHLIAYFYYNGEFVSANKHFEMDDCFLRVSASFSARQVPPGSPATLAVRAAAPAVCALAALDTAAPRAPHALPHLLLHSLKTLMAAHRNLTEYDAAGDCFFTEETVEPPLGSTELTATWLAAAGVRTVGDLPPRRQCDAAALHHQTTPRTDFSEAWLWRVVTVNSSGSASSTATTPDSITRFEASAVCISKTGIGISPPAILQVFREFFIHADGPRRLRRGDSAIYKYRIFNYLYEPLSVQVQILSDSLEISTPRVESICVAARGAAARRVAAAAGRAGAAALRLRAAAVRDHGCGAAGGGPLVGDEVEIKIKVDPEGFPVNEQKSILLCDSSDNNLSSHSEVNWSWSPVQAVPKTETLTVWAIGDIAGPILGDGGQLVPLPMGCGEQNMARVAHNVLAVSRLHPACAHAQLARAHLARGLTRQLQYVHPSGGFSAFASDSSPSTWLTAFCLRYLKRAHEIVWPNKPIPPAIVQAEKWLLAQQMENGCFRNEGQVFHRELRGGLNEEGEIASVALTAYVITSLLESTSSIPPRVIENTLSCLRALPLKYQQNRGYGPSSRIYAHSLLAYAFMRLKKYEEELRGTNEVGQKKDGLKEHEGVLEVMELIKMANREDDFMWWETNSLPTTIEATGYALLALKESPSLLHKYGAGAIRWLTTHRGPGQGFLSTQDTLVALEALSAWSSLQPMSANLTVTANVGNKSISVQLPTDSKIPEHFRLEGRNVTIGVKGTGCALIQATRTYNTLIPPKSDNKRLSVQLSVNTDGTFDCDADFNCYCAAVVEACVLWSGRFPDMALLQVALPGGYAADAASLHAQVQHPDTLIRRIELGPAGSSATLYLTSRSQDSIRGHACFSVQAVGPSTKTKPAYVRVMDYYTPTVYTIPEECPSRVTHDTSQDITDNLYNKARSVDDEILITHEFSFQDIPEGIPLEDPLYDNFRNKPEIVGHIEDIRDLNEDHYKGKVEEYLKQGIDKPSITVVTTRKDVNLERLSNDNIGNTNEKYKNAPKALFKNFEEPVKNVAEQPKFLPKARHLDDKLVSFVVPDGKLDLDSLEDKPKEIRSSTTISRIVVLNNATTETNSHASLKQSLENNEGVYTNANDKYSNATFNHTNIKLENNSNKVENPNLIDFHVIDSEKDLDVPTGIEGPVPNIVLPPKDFVLPPQNPSIFIPPPSDLIPSFNAAQSSMHPSPPLNFVSSPPNFISPPPYYSSTSNFASTNPNLFKGLHPPSYVLSPHPNISKRLHHTPNLLSSLPYISKGLHPPSNFVYPFSNISKHIPSRNLVPPPQNFAPLEHWQNYEEYINFGPPH